MEIISRDYVLAEKEKRRANLKTLQRHAYGGANHIGEMSPGCRICFTGEEGGGVQIGQECNCDCTVCYYKRGRNDEDMNEAERLRESLTGFFRNGFEKKFQPWIYAFQSAGETLMYIDQLL